MYDLIGDIHGYASALKCLLRELGYQEQQGTWQHPERKVIFLGDFVDRGPEQVETVQIARRMVEAGHALAVMGNHEFNAVAWATPCTEQPGAFLRVHSDKNREQHDAFLVQIGEGSQEHLDTIEWFRTLPLYLELEGLRVIHACWHPQQFEALAPHLDQQMRIRMGSWPAVCTVSVHSKTSCHPADFRPRVTSHSTTRGYFHEKTPHRRTVASPNRSAA